MRTSPQEDADLIDAYLHGDVNAFDSLYARYYPALVRHLARRGEDLAEDLAQETFIRAMRRIDSYDRARPLWPWLRRIATNAAIDQARLRQRTGALTDALAATAAADQAVTDPADARLVESDLLARAMREVPERQRAALERCYLEGWRPTEVAAEFGVCSNAFDQLLHRARHSLRRAYHRHNGLHDRAATLGWAVALLPPMQPLMTRLRQLAEVLTRVGDAGPRLGEAVAAAVLVSVVASGGPVVAPGDHDAVRSAEPVMSQSVTAALAPAADAFGASASANGDRQVGEEPVRPDDAVQDPTAEEPEQSPPTVGEDPSLDPLVEPGVTPLGDRTDFGQDRGDTDHDGSSGTQIDAVLPVAGPCERDAESPACMMLSLSQSVGSGG